MPVQPGFSYDRQRMANYYPFDQPITERAVEVIERQRQGEGVRADALPEAAWFHPKDAKSIQVLDLIPKDGYDKVLAYFQPLGVGHDRNLRFRLSTLHDMLPNTRLIAPGDALGSNRVPFSELRNVSHGDLGAKINPLLQYLESQAIDAVDFAGYSAGGELATAAATHGREFIETERLVVMEPASIEKVPLLIGKDTLASRFATTGGDIAQYVADTNSPEYEAARIMGWRGQVAIAKYAVGILRPTNIAMSKHMSHGGFEARMSTALASNPEMTAGIVWGTASELSIDALMKSAIGRLDAEHLAESTRIQSMAAPMP